MLNNRFLRILLSVTLAFGLWLYVITAISPDYTDTIHNIPIALDGLSALEERGLMVTGVSAERVALQLNGNRSDLATLNAGNTMVKIDLSRITEAGQTTLSFVPVYPGDLTSGKIKTVSTTPENVTVTVAKRTTKEVPVEIRWIGSARTGFITDRENRVLDYPTVQVTGPQEVVDAIEKALVEVDLTDRTESISDSFRYTLCNADDEPVDAKSITTNVENIHLEVKIRRFKDITLNYTLIEGGGATKDNVTVTLSLSTLRIAGSEAALEGMGDELIVGTINLAEIPKSTTMTFPITLPEGVSNLTGATEVTAEIKLSGLSTKELVVTAIHPINVPTGCKADVITESLTVIVRGPVEQITAIAPQNVMVTVDLSQAQLGTSTYKPTFLFGDGFSQVGALRSEPISVSLTEE